MDRLKAIIRTVLEGQSKIVVVPSETTKVFTDIDDAYANLVKHSGMNRTHPKENMEGWRIFDKFGYLIGWWVSHTKDVVQYTGIGYEKYDKIGKADTLEQAVRHLWLLHRQDKVIEKDKRKQTKLNQQPSQ